jgi:ABC-type branched-subunit amino acid transport system substrate-binding protein
VNHRGGVFGRNLELEVRLDDRSSASLHLTQVRSLVEEHDVFAVIPVASQVFSARSAEYLVEAGVPTFGWNISPDWSLGPNLFGDKGSFICPDCPQVAPVYVASRLGASRIALLAYGVPQSLECARGQRTAFRHFGFELAFEDTSLSFGVQNLGADVRAMREAGVDFVTTCMDVGGLVNVARAMRRAGMSDVRFYSPQGYSPDTVARYGRELDGTFFAVDFVPFEIEDPPRGMRRFKRWMRRSGKPITEQALAGWINADLLVRGLRAAGPDFDRQAVTDAINGIRDYTADGIRDPIDWPTDGHGPETQVCFAYVEARRSRFVPRFGRPAQPFVCFPNDPLPTTLDDPYYLPEQRRDPTAATSQPAP